jgi:hypothetical protein
MKKFLSSFLLFSLVASAQMDTSKLKIDTATLESIPRPNLTAIGIPYGNAVSADIGPEGGKISSEDGKVDLIFPKNALTTKTRISIQPTTNMLDSSKKAYQFEPSGTQFKVPVKIIFHYTDEEAETCPPDLKSFALQDHTGKWDYLEYTDWDSAGQTLSGFINHFSTLVTDQNDVIVQAEKPWMLLDDHSYIYIYHKRVIMAGPKLGQNDDPRFVSDKLGIFVNGIAGGNAKEGTANLVSAEGSHLGFYFSPDVFPTKNPVQIKVAFKYYSRIRKIPMWGKATCPIKLWDAYEISVKHTMHTRAGMDGVLTDHATCVAYIEPTDIHIANIKNYPPEVVKEGKHPPFKEKLYIDEAQGSIHLTERISMPKMMNKNFPREVYFEFEPVNTLWYKFKTGSRGMWTDKQPMADQSLRIVVWFMTDGAQHSSEVPVDDQEPYQVTVTRYKPK